MSRPSSKSLDLAAADPLSDVLSTIQLRTSVLGVFDFTAPWGMAVSQLGPAYLYAVIEGEALFQIQGADVVRIHAGDVLLTPAGDACELMSDPPGALRTVGEILNLPEQWTPEFRVGEPVRAHSGGGGAATRIVAMLLDFADDHNRSLRLHLPKLIHLTGKEASLAPWLAPAARAIAEEPVQGSAGYIAVATRLAELMFISTVQTHLMLRPDEASGWLRGTTDPRLARVLSAVHRDPAARWTVESLAQVAGMSRSSFAELFHRLLGETPLQHVTRWRLRLARDWIVRDQMSVKAAARAAGYSCPKAFSEAFRRYWGAPPSHFQNAKDAAQGRRTRGTAG